jgi:hypothetical protein
VDAAVMVGSNHRAHRPRACWWVSFLDRPLSLKTVPISLRARCRPTCGSIEDEMAGFPGTRLPCDEQGQPRVRHG